MYEQGSFPRRQAATRRFSLGAPRDIRVSTDGDRVMFLRSSGPEDPVNSLWLFDVATGEEQLVVDAATLGAEDHDLPAAERARRERARESGGGIVAYDATADLDVVVFALGGRLVRVDVGHGGSEMLSTAAGAFDPRLSPDGSRVAYVVGDTLRVVDGDGDRVVVEEAGDTVSWGSAEFVAGEEMGRTRGHWWSPDGDRLLVERVDVAPVEQWWISAPVTPDVAPTAVRYPAAGTTNADVGLAIVGLDGTRVEVDWQGTEWEYLADARWDDEAIRLTVQRRDQRVLAVLEVDAATGAVGERYRVEDEQWVELIPGTPAFHRGRLVTVEDRGAARRLCVDGTAMTGDEIQVRRVISATDEGVVITASRESTSIDVAVMTWDGGFTWLTSEPGVHGALVGGATRVEISRSLAFGGARIAVHARGTEVGRLVDLSETPELDVSVRMLRLGERELAAALLVPSGADDTTSLPVLVDPYGGPHAQRVQQSRALFHTSQWFADRGFAVLVTDGRGTPGRGPAFEREIRGDFAGPVLDDQIDALHAAAVLEPRLDLRRVAIRGWSFGGYLAALAVLRRPDVFHCAIAGAPVTDWTLYDTHYTERYLGDPGEEPDNYARSGLVDEPAGFDPVSEFPPLLLIHGLADDNVVVAHTLRLSRALLEAGLAHRVLPLSGVTHMTPQEEVAENLLLVQLSFLREALG
jgi:dipeptidyl-peptidase 4